MTHRLLLIEQDVTGPGESLVPLLASRPGIILEREPWDRWAPGRLQDYKAHLVVAGPSADRSRSMKFFEWLRTQPAAVLTFAVLPNTPDEELLEAAARAADDFTVSPVRQTELDFRLGRLLATERGSIAAIGRRLTDELGVSQLLGAAPAFADVLRQIPLIATSDQTVLVTGETGTGKELCARAIHHLSSRRDFPFIALDCAAVPDHLFENEFFGHTRGAFTDAHRDQQGLVSMAQGGTLFLDEIDAVSVSTQAKLLRFLEHHVYRPLGANRFVEANVRVIAATNANIAARIRENRFRADLFFRLNVLGVYLPPLRERRGDVAILAEHFLVSASTPADAGKSWAPSALRRLEGYDWPGNVRELLNVVRRAAVLCEGRRILPSHVVLPGTQPDEPVAHTFRQARAGAIANFERSYVTELLRRHEGNITRAARDAQKDRRAFGRLVKKYSIQPRSA